MMTDVYLFLLFDTVSVSFYYQNHLHAATIVINTGCVYQLKSVKCIPVCIGQLYIPW